MGQAVVQEVWLAEPVQQAAAFQKELGSLVAACRKVVDLEVVAFRRELQAG